MIKLTNGVVAGFWATVFLSILMIVKEAMGIAPALDVIGMLSMTMGVPHLPIVGWIAHVAIGTLVWGISFAFLFPYLPGQSYQLKGISLSILAWLLMMVTVMPMAGAGLFGTSIGIVASVMTFALHVIFGAVLGGTYGLRADKLLAANMK